MFGSTALFFAVISPFKNGIVAELLAHGANPNLPDKAGVSPLHYVVTSPFENGIVPNLMVHGSDPNLPDKKGLTPLDYAHRRHRPDLLVLLNHGGK